VSEDDWRSVSHFLSRKYVIVTHLSKSALRQLVLSAWCACVLHCSTKCLSLSYCNVTTELLTGYGMKYEQFMVIVTVFR